MTPGNAARIVGILREQDVAKNASTIIALAIAYSLPTPPAGSLDYIQYWSSNLMAPTNAWISDLAEKQVFSAVECAETAKDAWMLRFKSYAYPCAAPCPYVADFEAKDDLALKAVMERIAVEVAAGLSQ